MIKRIPWKSGYPSRLHGSHGHSAHYIGLGCNIGNHAARLRIMQLALHAIHRMPSSHILATSDIFMTSPWGITDQADFYNSVIAMQCSLPPVTLLRFLKTIEINLGRQQRERWGPREIDLDILLAGNINLHVPGLSIPHRHLHVRDFALLPLLQINPNATLPNGTPLSSFARHINQV